MLYFVNYLLNQSDDIFEQINILKENFDNEEVNIYLSLLDKDNLSPYLRYVVDKHIFDRRVEKEPPKTDVKLYPIYVNGYNEKQRSLKIELFIKSGDIVFIKKGPYANMQGTILYIDKNEVIIKLDLFGKIVAERLSLDCIGGIYNE